MAASAIDLFSSRRSYAVDEPDFATGYRYGAYEPDEDGSFTFVNGGDVSKGIWRLEDGLPGLMRPSPS